MTRLYVFNMAAAAVQTNSESDEVDKLFSRFMCEVLATLFLVPTLLFISPLKFVYLPNIRPKVFHLI